MAKKKIAPRRVPRTAEGRMFGDGKPSQAAAQAATGGAPGAVRPAAVRPGAGGRLAGISRGPVNLAQEYRYVLGDLRRLGILAVGTFAALIVLGLIIR